MRFIVGIGNPGDEYESTRHNVGFKVLDLLQRSWKKDRYLEALVAELDPNTRLLKPQTYVNKSGDTVRELVKRYQAAASDVLVVSDDVNLDYGKIRLRASGSAGGHHGLESIEQALGTDEYPRLRVGVRNLAMPPDLTDFVLGEFSKDEKKSLTALTEKAARVSEAWAKHGFEKAREELSRLQSEQKESSQ